MTVHKVFFGGDLRAVGYNHTRRADFQSAEIRYAGHLPTKHFVVPFYYDATTDEWRGYAAMHDEFATGDVVHTHALSADSRIDALVIHNKKPTGLRDEVTGAITTAAKVKFGLYDGETLVDETEEIDLSKVGRTVLEFGKPVAYKKTTKKDTNDDGENLVDETEEIDLSKVGRTGLEVGKPVASKKTTKKDTNNDGVVNKDDAPTTAITSLGAYLGNNGTIRMTVVDGSGFAGACLTAFVELVDLLDVRPCGCEKPACDSEYPDPVC